MKEFAIAFNWINQNSPNLSLKETQKFDQIPQARVESFHHRNPKLQARELSAK